MNIRCLQKVLFGFTVSLSLIMGQQATFGDDRVFTFRGTLPAGSTSHSQVSDGETFTAIFTIDPTVGDNNPDSTVGVYPDSVLSGIVVFSGGYGAALDFSGYDVYVLNNAGGVSDGVSVRNASGTGNIVQAVTNELGTLVSDAMLPAGYEFASSPATTTAIDFQLQLTDTQGSINYTSNVANNITFRSEDGVAWKGHNGFFDSSLNWIDGIMGGPPSGTDTALFIRDGNYEVWWDSITGFPTSENMIVRNGEVTFETQDSGDYSFIVSNNIDVERDATLNLSGVSGTSVGLDTTFMAIDGSLNITGETVVDVTTAVDIGREGDGAIRLTDFDNEFFVGPNAMYIGVRDIGLLEIRNGANVNDAGSPKIGAMFGGIGHVLVDGFGAEWNMLGDLEIGNASGSNGTLSIRNSGRVEVGGDLLISRGIADSPFNDVEMRAGTLVIDGDFMLGGSPTASANLNAIDGADIFVGNQFVIDESSAVTTSGSGIPDLTANTMLNYGRLDLGGDIGVDVHADVTNLGELSNPDSAINFFYQDVRNDGTRFSIDENALVVINGAYSGNGQVSGMGTLDFRGPVRPGFATGIAATGVVFTEGDVRMNGGSDFTVEVAGTNLNEFDRIWVDGELRLDGGQIQTTSIGGFSPELGDEFRVINVAVAATGFFSVPQGGYVGSIGATDVFIDYFGGDGNDVFLSTIPDPFVVGDVNFDGVVDLLDVQPFIELISTGSYVREGDTRRDGAIDLLDVEPFVDLLSGS